MGAMRISELSRRSGVPASTLRYYESEGLLPAQRAGNGYRIYGPDAVDRLAFIAQAKHLDLPLTAVRELATAWESEPCRSVRARYRPLLVERAGQVAERLVALQALRTTLRTAIGRLDALPDRAQACQPDCTFLDRPIAGVPTASSADDEGQQRSAGAVGLLPLADVAPIACTLGGGDYTERIRQWRDLLSGAPRTETNDGARVAVQTTLPTSVLERATALAAAEQGCCAFYHFRFELNGPSFDLTITAPSTAAEMLADLLPHDAGDGRTSRETSPR